MCDLAICVVCSKKPAKFDATFIQHGKNVSVTRQFCADLDHLPDDHVHLSIPLSAGIKIFRFV